MKSLKVALNESNSKLSDYSIRYESLLHERDDEKLLCQDAVEKARLLEQKMLHLMSNASPSIQVKKKKF